MKSPVVPGEKEGLLDEQSEAPPKKQGHDIAEFLKYGSLAFLILQNSSHVLLLRYSRVVGSECAQYVVRKRSSYHSAPSGSPHHAQWIHLQIVHLGLQAQPCIGSPATDHHYHHPPRRLRLLCSFRSSSSSYSAYPCSYLWRRGRSPPSLASTSTFGRFGNERCGVPRAQCSVAFVLVDDGVGTSRDWL